MVMNSAAMWLTLTLLLNPVLLVNSWVVYFKRNNSLYMNQHALSVNFAAINFFI